MGNVFDNFHRLHLIPSLVIGRTMITGRTYVRKDGRTDERTGQTTQSQQAPHFWSGSIIKASQNKAYTCRTEQNRIKLTFAYKARFSYKSFSVRTEERTCFRYSITDFYTWFHLFTFDIVCIINWAQPTSVGFLKTENKHHAWNGTQNTKWTRSTLVLWFCDMKLTFTFSAHRAELAVFVGYIKTWSQRVGHLIRKGNIL